MEQLAQGPVGRVLARLAGVRRSGAGWAAQCPAHADRVASLVVSEGADGRALVHCHAGCAPDVVLEALGVKARDLFLSDRPPADHPPAARVARPAPSRPPAARRVRHRSVYPVCDATGHLVAEHVRDDYDGGGKGFWWRRPGARHAGLEGLPTADLPLYGSEHLAALPKGATVVLVEGEKACDALRAYGLAAVATVTGAGGTPSDAVLEVLRERDVVLWPDADLDATKGPAHMARIAARLRDRDLVPAPRWLTVEGAADGDDAADVMVDIDTVRRWIAAAPPWTPPPEETALMVHATPAPDDQGGVGCSQPRDSSPTPKSGNGASGPDPDATTEASASPEAPDADEARLAELAAMPLLAYERVRDDAATELSVRVSILDRLVAPLRPRPEDTDAAGRAIQLRDPAPCAEKVDGAALLDTLRETYRLYVVLPDHADVALALWTLFAWTLDAFMVAPILAAISPEKRCGKTTLLHLLYALTPRAIFGSNITPAAVFRAVDRFKPTLIVDEADTFLQASDELRGVLNASHAKGSAAVLRNVGDEHEPRMFSTWCAKAIAMIGRLPDTLEDRAIVLPMKRKTPGETVTRLRLDRLAALDGLGPQAARWAQDHRPALETADPDVPGELHDRAQDNWRPLLAIADAVGGEWPAAARAAARALSGLTDPAAGNRPAMQLLADLRSIFDATTSEQLSTERVLEELTKLDESPWPTWGKGGKPMTAKHLANLLRPFGVRSAQMHARDGAGPDNVKGYTRASFADAFARYLPASYPNVPNTMNENNGLGQFSDPNGSGPRSDSEMGLSVRTGDGSSARSDRNPENGPREDMSGPLPAEGPERLLL